MDNDLDKLESDEFSVSSLSSSDPNGESL